MKYFKHLNLSFNQSATSRIDKIKTLDIAIAYVEHLQSLVNNNCAQNNTDERISSTKQDLVTEPKNTKPTLPTKISIGTNTSNQYLFDENLWYMRGVYNGSVELISYLIEYTQLGCENMNQMCESVELLLELFRQYHGIYFNGFKLNEKDMEFIMSSLKTRKFPLNNKKIIQKIKIALSNNNVQLPGNFYLSICKLLHRNYRRSSSTSSSESSLENREINNQDDLSSDSDKQINGNLIKRREATNFVNSINEFRLNVANNNRQKSISNLPSRNHLDHFDNDIIHIDNNSNNIINNRTLINRNEIFSSKKTAEIDEMNKAKKLKTNLIQRFNHMTHRSDFTVLSNNQMLTNNVNINHNNYDNVISANQLLSNRNETTLMSNADYRLYGLNADRNYISFNQHNSTNLEQDILFRDNTNYGNIINNFTEKSLITTNDVFSIFILHNSQDFYISACIDESLLDSNLVKNILKNKDFKPNALQKIKIDALFSSDIMISNRTLLRN